MTHTDTTTDLPIRIAVDVDSTLWGLLYAMARHPEGVRVRYEDCPTWDSLIDLCDGADFKARLGMMLELFDRCYTYDAMMREGLFPGALAEAQAWKAAGAEIYVMTARPDHAAADTERFLQAQNYPYDTFACAPKFDKVAACQELGIDVIVDDHPDTLTQAAEAGMTAMTLLWPYNSEVVARFGIEQHTTWQTLGPAALTAAHAARTQRALTELSRLSAAMPGGYR